MQVESWVHIPEWEHCPRAPCGTIASRLTTRSTRLGMEDSRLATPGTRLIVVQAHTRSCAFHCGVRTKECCIFRDPNVWDAFRFIDQAPPRSPPAHPGHRPSLLLQYTHHHQRCRHLNWPLQSQPRPATPPPRPARRHTPRWLCTACRRPF